MRVAMMEMPRPRWCSNDSIEDEPIRLSRGRAERVTVTNQLSKYPFGQWLRAIACGLMLQWIAVLLLDSVLSSYWPRLSSFWAFCNPTKRRSLSPLNEVRSKRYSPRHYA
jgi:hypothetical protein